MKVTLLPMVRKSIDEVVAESDDIRIELIRLRWPSEGRQGASIVLFCDSRHGACRNIAQRL